MYRRGIEPSKIAGVCGAAVTTVRYHLQVAAKADPGLRGEHAAAVPLKVPSETALQRMHDLVSFFRVEGRLPAAHAKSSTEQTLASWLYRRRRANLDIEQTRNQARALLDSRIESVTALVRSRQRITELRDQLVAAERDDKRAYVQATRDGWSADELKKLGLEPSAVKRRRTAKRSAGPEQGTDQGTNQEAASPTGEQQPLQSTPR